jgi:DNA-binding LacI/PurR family transcriptional regulator
VSVTVRDIAAAAGVSPGTASRALRGHPLISENCIARVRQVAESLGYRPLRDRSGRRRSEPLVGKRIAIAMLGIGFGAVL